MNPASQPTSTSATGRVCELTGAGRGAICVLGISGSQLAESLDRFFVAANGRPVSRQATRKPIYGRWNCEDVILCLHRSNYAEVHCHGGEFAKQAVLSDLLSLGIVAQEQWQFATEPCQTPIVMDAFRELARATTIRTAAILNWQTRGVLDDALASIRSFLESGALAEANQQIDTLLDRAALGMHLTQPWKIVVVGAANAGKSTLMNRLAGFKRSIVFDEPGTTRDLVTLETAIDGWPVELIDTAGLRTSTDRLEQQGMALTEAAIRRADLMVEVVDATDPHEPVFSTSPVRRVTVYNKCDVAGPSLETGLSISALTGQGIADLHKCLSRLLVPYDPPQYAAVPFLISHVKELQRLRQMAAARS